MTLTKLAKLANVSVSTASKAFSMSNEISEETRKIVFDVAKEHGCFREFFNARYGKHVIAVICPETKSRYYSSTVDAIKEGFTEKGYEVLVSTTDFSTISPSELFEYYSQYNKVDTIVFIDVALPITDVSVPTVFVGETDFEGDFSFIKTDFSTGYGEAFDYFKSKGITEFGYIGECKTANALKRMLETAQEKGCSFPEEFRIFSPERFEAGGYKAMETLNSLKKKPKVVFCGYDNMAIGALRFVADAGEKIPDDIMIVGKDNIPEGEYSLPRLSTIGFSKVELCNNIISDVTEPKENGKKTKLTVNTKFIKRESTK